MLHDICFIQYVESKINLFAKTRDYLLKNQAKSSLSGDSMLNLYIYSQIWVNKERGFKHFKSNEDSQSNDERVEMISFDLQAWEVMPLVVPLVVFAEHPRTCRNDILREVLCRFSNSIDFKLNVRFLYIQSHGRRTGKVSWGNHQL